MLQLLLDFTLHRLRAKLQFPSFTLGMVRGELSLTVFVQCGPVEDMVMEEYHKLKKNKTYLSSAQNPCWLMITDQMIIGDYITYPVYWCILGIITVHSGNLCWSISTSEILLRPFAGWTATCCSCCWGHSGGHRIAPKSQRLGWHEKPPAVWMEYGGFHKWWYPQMDCL